ncbi:hypothetical protein CQY20_18615, partial [Mycolicibacterium agri]
MAELHDITARLAEGRPAVDTIGDYVWACHLLGYQNPDLTLHAAQVRDWYSSEDGMDLGALEADRVALVAAAAAAEDAQRLQDKQFDVLAAAWQGRGGEASHGFLERHGEASAAAVAALRHAADTLSALRDDLWRAVDDKVTTAVAIDDRRQAERPAWLAATRTVTTGVGDRAVASELVDQEVKPFVNNDIRSDWLTAMQKAIAAVSAAFDAATGALTGQPATPFEVPGDLGPTPTAPSGHSDVVTPAAPAAGWASPASAAPAPIAGPPPAAPPATATSAPPPPSVAAPEPAPIPPPAMPSLGEIAGGLPNAARGLAGLGSQLADAIGGLFDRSEYALPDAAELKDNEDTTLDDDETREVDETPGDKPDDEKPDDEPEDEKAEETEELAASDDGAEADEPQPACPEEATDPPPAEEPAPTPPPAP